jgi:hypothetical protein
MRRQLFQNYLATSYNKANGSGPLSPASVANYGVYAGKAELALDADLDDLDLSSDGLVAIAARLKKLSSQGALTAKEASDYASSIRAYAQFAASRDALATSGPDEGDCYRPTPVRRPQPNQPVSGAADPMIAHLSVVGLLSMHGAIMDELRTRGIVRTSNAPGGDFAETLFSRAFGWSLENNSALGFDAIDKAGLRYQIKSRRLSRQNGSRQLSAIRRLPERTFDYLAAVLFNERYEVSRAIILPHEVVESRARYGTHTNSWKLMLEDKLWDIEGARDVTAIVASAAQGL